MRTLCVCVCEFFCVCVCVYFSMCVMDKLKISLLYFFMFFVFFLHGQTQDPPPHFLPSPVLSPLSAHREQRRRVCRVHWWQIQTNIRPIGVHGLPLWHLRDSGLGSREF